MASKKTKKAVLRKGSDVIGNIRQRLQVQMLQNATSLMSRGNLARGRFGGDVRRDLYEEAGYPEEITSEDYRRLYNRNGLAQRIVKIWPKECWKHSPSVYENEETGETGFEVAWNLLQKRLNVFAHLQKVDELSGIGRFGVLLFGFPGALSSPVLTIDAEGALVPRKGKPLRLLYLRVFDESSVTVDTVETDKGNPRFGKPLLYTIKLSDVEGDFKNGSFRDIKVHWTRILHVADNCEDSITYGVPRLEPHYNRVYDAEKVCGGAGEMFYKGGFPGTSFEVNPDIDHEFTDDEKQALKDEISNWSNGLQRTLLLTGVQAKSLSPQVADPGPHMEVITDQICIKEGIPKRIFMGSERGELASTQDKETWNERVKERQENYITPNIIREFVDRLMAVGVLPFVVEVFIDWPDLNKVSDLDKAQVAKLRTDALAAYVAGDVETVVPPKEYMTLIMEMSTEEVEQILKAEEDYQGTLVQKTLDDAETEAESMKIKGTDPETTMKLKAKVAPPKAGKGGGFPFNSKNGNGGVKIQIDRKGFLKK